MKKNENLDSFIAIKTLVNNEKKNILFEKIPIFFKQWFFIILKTIIKTLILILLLFTSIFILIQFSSFSNELNTFSSYFDKYFFYLGHLLTFNFGYSASQSQNVSSFIWNEMFLSFFIIFITMLIASIIGFIFGSLIAIKNFKGRNLLTNFLAIFSYALPSIFFGVIFLVLFPNISLDYYYNENLALFLVIISLSITTSFFYIFLIYKFLNKEKNARYVEFLYAKGLNDKEIFRNHFYIKAVFSYIYYFPFVIMILTFNSVALELLFGVPGVSSSLFNAVNNNDQVLLIDCLMIYGIFLIVIFNLRELILTMLNPKFRRMRGE